MVQRDGAESAPSSPALMLISAMAQQQDPFVHVQTLRHQPARALLPTCEEANTE